MTFLETIYNSVAETLPDIKDDGLELNVHTSSEQVDPYAPVAVPTADGESEPVQPVLKSQKVRKHKRGLTLNLERTADKGYEIRHLPPGCMKDYFEQFRLQDPTANIAFSTFWKTWRVEYSFLRFRPTSSHAQCSTCLHHRCLLRELSGFLRARERQARLFHQHLLSQYADRQAYWALRSQSRLRNTNHITIIQDGMDQCKFAWPRTPLCRGKDLNTMIRPRLSIVGCLAHGYCLFFTASDQTHAKDSSTMAEIFSHMLTRLAKLGVRLTDTYIHLIADNTSRETKNSTTLRLLTALVQRRASIEICWIIIEISCWLLDEYFWAY